MPDIDLEDIAPSAPQAGDARLVRRGTSEPYTAALIAELGGSAVLAFGAPPGSTYVTATITNAGIAATSRVKVWVQGTTDDHNDIEHLIIGGRMGLYASPATGSFTVHAETQLRLSGDIAIVWEAA